ncbi:MULTISPECIES: TRAP transporter small permease subunit [unclassified Roseovarius]|uniref:TRAP transporter small permease subunit n=1 Tax=unclassified Roseovarius TaxID=2614913 RepID=UPI00273DBACA|nr:MULTISPECIES: TRAP transporter small permease [unclassified Roseovarius]
MAGNSTVLQDDGWLSRLDRGLLKLERFFALLSGIAAFSLMFLAAYSVSGREFFESPLPGYVDWIEALMPLIAIMGVAYVQREGGHIRMDILIGALRGRALWALELMTVSLMLVLMIALVWGSWAHFDRSFDMTKPLWSRDSSIDIGLPIWPTKLLVPVAFSVLSLRLVIQVWAYGRALVLGLERPVAVPLYQSVAEQAEAEAKQLEGAD